VISTGKKLEIDFPIVNGKICCLRFCDDVLGTLRDAVNKLDGGIGKDEVAVLRKGTNRIDVLNHDEYFRDSHKNLWDF